MRKPKPQKLPESHLCLMQEKGFEALSWQNVAIEVRPYATEEMRREWLPRHMVNWERRLFVQWNESPTYGFPGWEPQDGHTNGGRYDTVAGALGWFDWLDAQKAKRS